jgi:adenylate kinase
VGDDIVVSLLSRALELRSTLPDPDAALDPWDVERNGKPHRPEGCIIDGFPRTVSQAQTLEFLFSRLKRKIDCVVAIDVPREELVHRIHERAAISGRSDDTEDVIRHRIELYDQQTTPVLDYYRVSGLLVSVDGSGEISETNGRICQTLDFVMNLKTKR